MRNGLESMLKGADSPCLLRTLETSDVATLASATNDLEGNSFQFIWGLGCLLAPRSQRSYSASGFARWACSFHVFVHMPTGSVMLKATVLSEAQPALAAVPSACGRALRSEDSLSVDRVFAAKGLEVDGTFNARF